ncbi:MAG TPA: DUF1015 family protein [Thermoanaerobaculia bacterium]|nr:DUF1015 family protein [Thermoanaerobaculia bacterium]
MELRPFRALRGTPRFKERRPGLWIDRQVAQENGVPVVRSILIGLVRVSEKAGVILPEESAPADAVSKRVGALVGAKSDSEPCLLSTRAPLSAAVASTRAPDMTFTDESGVRHDLIRVNDFAQHVELQGLVKSAEAAILDGLALWEAAVQFSASPAAVKLPGARFKLCAIADERLLSESPRRPEFPAGVLGYAFEDPVY